MCCDVPLNEAPELFEYDQAQHCYVCKQPSNANELEQILNAIQFSETQCIRYRGNDPDLLKALKELDLAEVCDSIGYPDPPDELPKKSWWKFW